MNEIQASKTVFGHLKSCMKLEPLEINFCTFFSGKADARKVMALKQRKINGGVKDSSGRSVNVNVFCMVVAK